MNDEITSKNKVISIHVLLNYNDYTTESMKIEPTSFFPINRSVTSSKENNVVEVPVYVYDIKYFAACRVPDNESNIPFSNVVYNVVVYKRISLNCKANRIVWLKCCHSDATSNFRNAVIFEISVFWFPPANMCSFEAQEALRRTEQLSWLEFLPS